MNNASYFSSFVVLCFLFALLFADSAFAGEPQGGIIYDQCVATLMTGFSPDDFYSAPQDVPLSYCDESSGNTCCTREYSEQIGDFADPFSSSFAAVIRTPITECRTMLEDISCIMCSTAQSDWIYLNNAFSSLVMCKSFCEDLYSTCGSQATIDGPSVIETYPDASGFCIALFDEISHSDASVKVLIDPHNNQCWKNLPECTADSFYQVFTECIEGRRNMLWVKKPEVQCAGGYENPPNEANLPCAIPCEAGERVGSDGSCESCEAGSFSRGSDFVIDSWSSQEDLVDNGILHFNSYCTWTDAYGVERIWTKSECKWNLNFGAMSSPLALNDSMSAYLETSVTMLEDGVFSFSAKVDSEQNYDGLKVFIDRQQSDVVSFISHTSDFSVYSIDLPMGYHFVQLVYYKDISVSVGLDQATINMIGFTNVRYASDYCTPCDLGKFMDEGHATQCYPCPLNTFTDTLGSTECTPCPEGMYAYEGSSECEEKPDCDSDSVYSRFGPCFYDEDTNEPRRELSYHWVEPHICKDDSLPEPELVECSPCEPGMYRDEDGIECFFCEPGFYSEGDDSPCMPCSVGNEAVKHLVFDEFNAFAYGLSTSCEYDCNREGGDGWVMREDLIDSGTGHGTYVVSTLTFVQTFTEKGSISFEFSLICEAACLLSFNTDSSDSYRAFGGSGVFWNPTNVQQKFMVEPGEHSFEWIFTRDDRNGIGMNDRAQINWINAENVAEGGAIDCTPCTEGTYNPYDNQVNCIRATEGFYAPGGSAEQFACDGETYTDTSGSSSCKSCGENVNALPDHTGCDVTCMFSNGNLLFDLSPMARNDSELYGPIWDHSNHTYYLNMCEEQHNGHTCFSADGEPLETFACQVSDIGQGQDLGSTFGILPLRDGLYPLYTYGATVHLDNGAQCHNGSHYFPRQTFIDVICDPTAGVGSPIAIDPIDNIVETQKCVYEFKWTSLYGCPLCQESDFHFIASACVDGFQTLTYEWNTNPRSCHGGIELPEPSEVPCASATYCGPGQYFDFDISDCLDAPAGFYSIGNGFKVSEWNELPPGFTSNGWKQTQNYVSSGEGDTSLLYVQNFVREGSIEFSFVVNNYGDSTAGFSIFIDDVLQGYEIHSTDNNYITQTINIPSGYHYIKFAFEGGTETTTNSRARGVRINEFVVLGVTWASSYPIPCPAGTYSNRPGSTSCVTCGWNTHSYEASHRCMGCPSSTYSFPGSSTCTTKEDCTLSDYSLVYSECSDGTQNAAYVLVEPVICAERVPPTPEEENVPCFDCSLGSYRAEGSDECKTCSVGKYWNEEQEKCKSAKAGHAATLLTSYFLTPISGEEFPEEFNTGCSGDCFCSNSDTSDCSTDGWRFRGDYADSGLNENRDVDSYLELALELENNGKISFDYEVLGHSGNGLEFFINEKQYDVSYHPSGHSKAISGGEFEVNSGLNVFKWNYHQEPDTTGSVLLTSVIVEGIGGATEDTLCAAGEFSEESGASVCSLCPVGTASDEIGATGCNVCGKNSYAPSEGSVECIECGSGTEANSNRTDCETDCKFVFGNSTYDLSYLQHTHGPFPIDDGTTGIWMNVCEKRSSQSFCLDSYGDSINTYMCEVDTRGNGIDYGNHLSAELVEVEDSDDKAIRLSYTVEGDDDDTHCQSTVTVVCDPDSTSQVPFILGNAKDCDLHMRWNSEYGCRVCDDKDDYYVQESECEHGERTLTTVRKNNCNGPVILDFQIESCPTRYSFPLAALIVVGVLVLVLIVIIAGAIVYNRRLHGQYTALVRDSEGQYEMDNIDEDTAVSDDQVEKSETEAV